MATLSASGNRPRGLGAAVPMLLPFQVMHSFDRARRRPVCASFVTTSLLAAFIVSGCGGMSRAPAPSSPDVWATVDDREIRKDVVERADKRVAPASPVPSEEEALSAKLRLLAELVDQDILIARARALKVEVPDADLEKAFSERKSNMTEEAFQKEISQRGLTADEMRQDLRRELTVQKLLEQEVASKITIGDDAVRAFFEKNRAQFNVAETRHRIAQIVVTPVRDPRVRNRANSDAATPAEARGKLQMIVDRLKSGTPFSQLAMDYSEDPQSAPQGGDLGLIPNSQLNQVPPQLRDAVLKAKPGDVATVTSPGGYIIVLVAGREEAGQRDLGSPGVKEGITNMLRERQEQLLGAAYLAAARNDVRVVNHLAKQIVDARKSSSPPAAPGSPTK
jgi:peptidyl-prolyl cis-trans isomerase SurA